MKGYVDEDWNFNIISDDSGQNTWPSMHVLIFHDFYTSLLLEMPYGGKNLGWVGKDWTFLFFSD